MTTISSQVLSTLRIGLLGGFLGLVAASGWAASAVAAEPCPAGSENSAACSRWQNSLQRLEEAAKQAEAAAAQPATPLAPTDPLKARARTVVADVIAFFSQTASDLTLRRDADYTLIEDGDGFRATVEKVFLTDEAQQIDLAPFTIWVQPRSGQMSLVSYRFADTLIIREGEQVLGRIRIGEQQHRGIWNEALQNFAHLDSRMAPVELIVPSFSLAVGSVRLADGLVQGEQNAWSRQVVMDLTNIDLQAEGTVVKLDRLISHLNVDGYEFRKLLLLNSQLGAMRRESVGAPEGMLRRFRLLGELADLLVRFDGSFIASDVLIASGGQQVATLGQLAMSFGFDEPGDAGSQLDYTFAMTDLKSAAPVAPAELVPTDARLELGFAGIPRKAWARVIEIAAASEQIEDEAMREAFLSQQMLALVMESGLGMYVKDSFVTMPGARVDLGLRSAVDQQAAMGGTAELDLRIEGFDKLIEAAGALGDEESAQFMAMLMAFSDRTEQDGKTVDSFVLQVTREGQLWLNGKDMTVLFGEQPGAE